MKIIILIIAVFSVFLIAAPTTATSPSAGGSTHAMPVSVIDEISVPLDVLNFVQTEHQGYAVTKASKQSRQGKQAYVLQASRDTNANRYESLFFIYDMSWNLMTQETAPPPQPPPDQKKQEEKKEQNKPRESEDREGRGNYDESPRPARVEEPQEVPDSGVEQEE